MKKNIIIVVGAVAVISCFLSGCIGIGSQPLLEIDMEPDVWYKVVITQEMIDAVGSNQPEMVFASLNEQNYAVSICYSDNDCKSYIHEEPANNLNEIVPYEYHVRIVDGEPDTLIIPPN